MSHARLYIARSLTSAQIPETLRIQSADREHVIRDTFGIDDARSLTSRAHIRAVEGGERAFLIQCNSITSEAQNALLKLFEEPPEQVTFHLIVSDEGILLPTLLSRLQLIAREEDPDDNENAATFLAMSYAARLEEIARRTKQKDTAWIESVVSGIERSVRDTTQAKDASLLSSLLLVRSYLGTRGASAKMLLEELALSLPPRSA